MDDGRDGVFCHPPFQLSDGASRREVYLKKRNTPDSSGDACREVIGNQHSVASQLEVTRDMASDIPGAAGDQNAHRFSVPATRTRSPARLEATYRAGDHGPAAEECHTTNAKFSQVSDDSPINARTLGDVEG